MNVGLDVKDPWLVAPFAGFANVTMAARPFRRKSNSAEVQVWPIDRLIAYARNPRKNDAAVDRMCASIRKFGFKIPCLARSDGEAAEGSLF
jgi:hypothetical protein